MVAAAPTTVAAIATEAAVSGRAQDTLNIFLPCPCDFPPIKDQELGHNDIKYGIHICFATSKTSTKHLLVGSAQSNSTSIIEKQYISLEPKRNIS